MIQLLYWVCAFVGNEEYWNYLLGLTVVPATFQIIVLSVCPESPRYELVNKGNRESAMSGKHTHPYIYPLIMNTLEPLAIR